MFFEVYKQGNLIIRGRQILNTISLDNELMLAPSTSLVLPIDWLKVIDGREEVKIFLDECRVFWGIVWDIEVDKMNEVIELDLRHVVTEWEYRQISVNHAISNEQLNIVYKGEKIETNVANDETITASGFSIMRNDLLTMSTAQLVVKAGASAWVTSNGEKVAITAHVVTGLTDDGNSCQVTFYTAKGTGVTVDVEVMDEADTDERKTHSDKKNKETISAVPFTTYTSRNLTQAQVIAIADAKAWVYKKKNKPVAVTTVVTNFVNVEGTYLVTAYTAKGTAISVEVKVENDDKGYGTIDDPAVVDKLEDIYSDMNFAYPGWELEFQGNASGKMIDYVYSRQNKLDALTQTMELTDNLWWRVGLWNEKKIQIGEFGEVKPYTLSTKPSGKTNIRIINEPTIDYDFENVINVATVYSDKSDGGMSSLTLREVYQDPTRQKQGFPVVILHANVNNERDYRAYITQYPKLAPNNEIEYAVIDEESIALESGTLIEGTYAFNDLSPFEIDGKDIGDDKRIQAAETVYQSVIKKLIQARRSYNITVTTEPIPCDLEVGDKIRFLYDNNIWNLEACSSYWKKILSYDDLFYVTAITYNYDEYGNLTNQLTLTKWLKIERETSNSY